MGNCSTREFAARALTWHSEPGIEAEQTTSLASWYWCQACLRAFKTWRRSRKVCTRAWICVCACSRGEAILATDMWHIRRATPCRVYLRKHSRCLANTSSTCFMSARGSTPAPNAVFCFHGLLVSGCKFFFTTFLISPRSGEIHIPSLDIHPSHSYTHARALIGRLTAET